jgi:hypothetical protein
VIQLAVSLLFAGYLLFYAAVHDGGKHALAPWNALQDGAAGQTGSQPASYATPGAGPGFDL